MSVNYCGGIPEMPKAGMVNIVVLSDRIEIVRGFQKNLKIYFQDIKNVSLKTEEQISKDVTLTRLLTLGIFAFGAKKKRKSTSNYLLIEYISSGIECTAIFIGDSIPKISSSLARSRQEYLANNPINNPESPTASNDVHSEIEKFFELKEKGIITEEEFNLKKKSLLGI